MTLYWRYVYFLRQKLHPVLFDVYVVMTPIFFNKSEEMANFARSVVAILILSSTRLNTARAQQIDRQSALQTSQKKKKEYLRSR